MNRFKVNLPDGLSVDGFEAADTLIHEYECADEPNMRNTEGARLSRTELIIRLYELLYAPGHK